MNYNTPTESKSLEDNRNELSNLLSLKDLDEIVSYFKM